MPTAIRTFVLHPVGLLASNPSSKNSAAAPHLRFFRRLFTVFHGTVKSAGLHQSVQLLARGLTERLHSTTSRNLTPVIGWVRCAVHATSPRPSLCDQSWAVPDFCLGLHQYRLGSVLRAPASSARPSTA